MGLLDILQEEAAKWGNGPSLGGLLMRDKSTKGIRGYAGNVAERGKAMTGLLQGREPTDAQKGLFSGLDPTTNEGAMNFALTFAGPMAKTANLAKLKIAEAMKAQGVPDAKIHADTGWFFGMADGKPRFEISDNTAEFDRKLFSERGNNDAPLDARAYVNHPELWGAYSENVPQIKKQYQGGLGPVAGSYSSTDNIISISPENALPKSTTLHELQHAIQQREGFARGGSQSDFPTDQSTLDLVKKLGIDPKGDASKVKYDLYRRLAGEAEARLTQSRMNMAPEQRAASYPPSMFDVPVNQQIVRGLLK
jgi:hypothetical protein